MSQDAYLYNTAEAFLLSCPSPDSLSEAEQLELSNKLKPLRYGLISQAISGILETKLSEDEMAAAKEQQEIFNPPEETSPIQKVRLYILRRYIGQCQKYFETSDDNPIMTTLERLNDLQCKVESHHWSEIEMSLIAGVGTATDMVEYLLTGCLELLATEDLQLDDKEAMLRKSYGALIEIAHLDAYQLIAARSALEEGVVVFQFAPSGTSVRLSKPVLTWDITESARKDAGHIASHIELSDQVSTIEQMTNQEIILGCPVLFQPDQIKDMWNGVIDKALEYGAVS